ncbi:MAG: hypothetical protein AB7E69_11310 [Sphingomonadales bacterium]
MGLAFLAACGGDESQDRAKRLSEETAGAVFNGGLAGTVQKGQSVALDASLTLTQTRIACILDEGRIPQIADCGPESGWTSVSAQIPLRHVEPGSVSVASPDRGRGQDGLLVYFACRKEAGQCVRWTSPMPSSANGGILCKTQKGCEKAAEDFAALVALAQPDAAPAETAASDERVTGFVETIGKEVAGAWFNNGTVGSIERQKSLALENGSLRLNAEICLGTDGRTLDMARCGAELNWIAMIGTVHPREIDPGSVAISAALPENGETGVMVTARCWKYAGKCIHYSAPVPDQASLSLICKTAAGCDAVKAALVSLVRLAQEKAAEEAGGAAGLAARMEAGRRDVTQVSPALLAAKKGGGVTVDAGGVLRLVESSCFIDGDVSAIAETCAAHADYWTDQETAVAQADIDPATIEDSSVDDMGNTLYLKCRTDRGACMTLTSTGAYPERKTAIGTNVLCRGAAACRQMAADLVTLAHIGGK